MRRIITSLMATALIGLAQVQVSAQSAMPAVSTPSAQTLSAEQLDALIAPVALYDDQLLAQVLMASTYPLEVVQASRWAKENKTLKGEALKSAVTSQSWDDSVKTLAAVPVVLDMMSTKLDWTQKLGDAVLAQQPDVMDSIQRLRSKAKAQGKLTSTKQQTVTVNHDQPKDVIVIDPAEQGSVYVPYYDPSVVYGAWSDPAYPPYFFTPPGYIAGAAIATGIVWGTAWAVGRAIANGGFNWGGNNIVVNRNANINNIGNRIGNNNNFQNWQHNPAHRQGVRYGNDAVRQKFSNANAGGQNQRLDFRGRDGGQVLRPGSDRANIGDRNPGGNRPNVADRGGNNRPTQVNRPQRDSGFANTGSRARTAAQSNRGRQSLNASPGARSFAGARPSGGQRAAARPSGGRAGAGGGRRR